MSTKSVRIDTTTYRLLKARARREGRTLTGMIRWLVTLEAVSEVFDKEKDLCRQLNSAKWM